MAVLRPVWFGVILLALASADARAVPDCYVLDRDGVEHRVACRSRLVVREVESRGGVEDAAPSTEPLDSPAVLRALLYRGAVIPLEDVRYVLPTLGVYVLKDGHQIEANPLALCGFSREYRFADLEQQRHRSTASGQETPPVGNGLLVLEVYVEFAATDTVAGYPVSESRLIPVHDAHIVTFAPGAIDGARKLWASRATLAESTDWFFPFSTRLRKGTDLRADPDGERAAKLGKGTAVEVLEVRDEWVKVRVEGWAKRDALEEKER